MNHTIEHIRHTYPALISIQNVKNIKHKLPKMSVFWAKIPEMSIAALSMSLYIICIYLHCFDSSL